MTHTDAFENGEHRCRYGFPRLAGEESELHLIRHWRKRPMDPASAIVTTATFLVSAPAAAAGVSAYRAFGGLREVSCPETMEAALVRIHVTRAIASRFPVARTCA
jgi:hypothetical protein